MQELLRQIEAALNANLFYLALFVSLSLPDICAGIDSPDGTTSGAKYGAWFDTYVAPKYQRRGNQILSGEDCYRFRCSLLHQGSSQHRKSSYSRVLFVEPSLNDVVMHCNVFDGTVLNLDVRIFCTDLIKSVEEWLNQVENTQQYQTNYDKFMRRYPQGLPPYIVGVPVIS